MAENDFSTDVARIAALDNPVRAALYDHIVELDDWLSRDDAAEHVDAPRSVAAFHLDKLVEAGLVETRFVRTSGRTGPGAGRPSKLYRRSELETSVSIPERRYSLAGHLLATAVEESSRTGKPVDRILSRLARKAGAEIGKHSIRRGKRTDVLVDVLADTGYEPHVENGEVVLRNCPFHELSRGHTDLVCGMNLELLRGVTEVVSQGKMTPRLQPEPGRCCVRISVKPRSNGR
jgi:predicted ArsR family transcriptional regulator